MYIKSMRRYASMVNEIDFIGKTVDPFFMSKSWLKMSKKKMN